MKKNRSTSGLKENLVDKAVHYLTREILADRLRPNQRISEVAVCRKLGISRSPVREALRMLERDGLVKQSGNRGVIVADITPEEADELYLVHGHLIGLATRLASRTMKGKTLGDMRNFVDKLRRASEKGDRHGFLETRAELERFICDHSFSSRLAHLFEVMAYPSARYRVFHVSVPGYMEEVVRCYEGVCDAFSRGDDLEAERCRLKIMDIGRQLLKRYFIEPHGGYRHEDLTTDHP
ncbi:MAG TPA: GntR family transcriptional regulator [Candidatus Binatia bacterium]|nr:GntR family transcriptional regulator [Candidatus Binatia bacterium]